MPRTGAAEHRRRTMAGDGQWQLRESGQQWPRGGHRRNPARADSSPGRQRILREPEPFERRGDNEGYPGGKVLEDLLPGETTEPETLRVLARYTVVRLFQLWGLHGLTGAKLLTERRVATQHLKMLPPHDWERRSLDKLTLLCRDWPSRAAVLASLAPAEAAAKRGHGNGAFALYRTAFEIALHHGWLEDAVPAAAGIARLARMYEAPRAARLWTWRARVTEVRLARQRVAEALAAAEAAREDQPAEDGGV
jgi:hypothetical protein